MEWNVETAFNVAKAFLQYAQLQGERSRLAGFRQNVLLHLPGRRLTLRIYDFPESTWISCRER